MGWPPCARRDTKENQGWAPPPRPLATDSSRSGDRVGCSGDYGPRISAKSLQAPSQNKWGTPWPSQSKGRDSGWFLAEVMGKTVGAWGHGTRVPKHPHTLPSPHGPEPGGLLGPGGSYCLAAGPERVPFTHYFWPRRKRKRKQRKELLFSAEPCPGNDSRARWVGRGSRRGIQRSCA